MPPNFSIVPSNRGSNIINTNAATSIAESIKIQKSAFKKNTQLLKPSTGIDYTKISYIHQDRLNNIRTYMRKFSDYGELFLSVNATLDNLSFGIEATKFEAALKDVGALLGYVSQRPDKEIRKGPDNLWCGSNDHYLLFECKSEDATALVNPA